MAAVNPAVRLQKIQIFANRDLGCAELFSKTSNQDPAITVQYLQN